jgi:hypothetical protein
LFALKKGPSFRFGEMTTSLDQGYFYPIATPRQLTRNTIETSNVIHIYDSRNQNALVERLT